MFKQKNILISLAVAALLTACGGGGNDSADTTAPASETPPATTTPPGDNNTPPVVTPPVVTPPVTTPPDTTTPPVVVDETMMSGYLQVVSNQLVFGVSANNIATIEQFKANADWPMGVGTFPEGDNAPLKVFGFRVMAEEMAPGGVAQKKNVRIALELKEENATVVGTEKNETVQLIIDQVEISVSADNKLSVSVPSTAKAYVYIQDVNGATTTLTVDALPAAAVKLNDIQDDTSSKAFVLDLDALFARIIASTGTDATKKALAESVKNFAGTFAMNATVSNVMMSKSSDGSVLTGEAITVTGSNQPAVTGAGVAGRLNVQ